MFRSRYIKHEPRMMKTRLLAAPDSDCCTSPNGDQLHFDGVDESFDRCYREKAAADDAAGDDGAVQVSEYRLLSQGMTIEASSRVPAGITGHDN